MISYGCQKITWIIKGVGGQNIQTSHQGDLRKTRHVK